jgi:hypothetical protein
MAMKFGPDNVLPSRNVNGETPAGNPGPPKEGDARAITSMVPIASGGRTGSAAPNLSSPRRRGVLQFYGQGK